MIQRYYETAPAIVEKINVHPDKEKIYDIIWNEYILQCVRLIENGDNEATKTLYVAGITGLLDLDKFIELHTGDKT